MTAAVPRGGPSRRARLTGATVAGVALCLGAGAFELSRALGGNSLSWVYTVEWPLIAAYGIYIWHKLVTEDAYGAESPHGSRDTGSVQEQPDPGEDPALAAWQDYLTRLHAADPPGGPPAREPGV